MKVGPKVLSDCQRSTVPRKEPGGSGEDRTRNLGIKNPLHYRCATDPSSWGRGDLNPHICGLKVRCLTIGLRPLIGTQRLFQSDLLHCLFHLPFVGPCGIEPLSQRHCVYSATVVPATTSEPVIFNTKLQTHLSRGAMSARDTTPLWGPSSETPDPLKRRRPPGFPEAAFRSHPGYSLGRLGTHLRIGEALDGGGKGNIRCIQALFGYQMPDAPQRRDLASHR